MRFIFWIRKPFYSLIIPSEVVLVLDAPGINVLIIAIINNNCQKYCAFKYEN